MQKDVKSHGAACAALFIGYHYYLGLSYDTVSAIYRAPVILSTRIDDTTKKKGKGKGKRKRKRGRKETESERDASNGSVVDLKHEKASRSGENFPVWSRVCRSGIVCCLLDYSDTCAHAYM